VKRYRLSPEAGADLDGIWEYVAKRSSIETATEFVERFLELFAFLGAAPLAGRSVPKLGPPGTRRFPLATYLVYYKPGRNRIVIWRIIDGSRRQSAALRSVHTTKLRGHRRPFS
jgi:plasmid stabilization system protein ParE